MRHKAAVVGLALLPAIFLGCSRSNQEEAAALRAELEAAKHKIAELKAEVAQNKNGGKRKDAEIVAVYLTLAGAKRATGYSVELEGLPLQATNFRDGCCDLYDHKGKLFAGIMSEDAYTLVSPEKAKVAASCEFYKRMMGYTDYQPAQGF